jgi:hypothetical protein
MPTQTNVSDNRSNGYGCLNIAHVWSSTVLKACHDPDGVTYQFLT